MITFAAASSSSQAFLVLAVAAAVLLVLPLALAILPEISRKRKSSALFETIPDERLKRLGKQIGKERVADYLWDEGVQKRVDEAMNNGAHQKG